MTKLFKNILILLSSISLLTVIVIFGILWTFSNNIPDYKFLKNYKPPVSSKMYSGDGDLVADFSKEKRIFVPYSAIPSNVINAFLPKQLSEEETKKICEEVIKSVGASSMKDMGKVMGALKSKHADTLDFSKVSGIIKGLLN